MPSKKKPAKPAISDAARDRLMSFGFITDKTKVDAVNYVAEENRTLEIINFDNGNRLITVNRD